MRILGAIALAIASLSFAACTSMPSATPSAPRSIILNGEKVSDTQLSKFVSWRCKDFVYGSRTLVEVGIFTNPKLSGGGFILFDGGNSGVFANYHRQGLDRRWDWGPKGDEFAFIIKPDGTGLYYDFSSVPSGRATKANAVYKCSQ